MLEIRKRKIFKSTEILAIVLLVIISYVTYVQIGIYVGFVIEAAILVVTIVGCHQQKMYGAIAALILSTRLLFSFNIICLILGIDLIFESLRLIQFIREKKMKRIVYILAILLVGCAVALTIYDYVPKAIKTNEVYDGIVGDALKAKRASAKYEVENTVEGALSRLCEDLAFKQGLDIASDAKPDCTELISHENMLRAKIAGQINKDIKIKCEGVEIGDQYIYIMAKTDNGVRVMVTVSKDLSTIVSSYAFE